MANEWDGEVKAWDEFEGAEAEKERLWEIMDNLLGSGEVRGVAEQHILENYADAMDAAIEKTKTTWNRWKEEVKKALTKTL